MKNIRARTLRKRRSVLIVIISLLVVLVQGMSVFEKEAAKPISQTDVLAETSEASEKASDVLERLEVKGRAPKTGYKRSEFGDGWADVGGCDTRNIMLRRGMTTYQLSDDGCIVLSGTLPDPYTGQEIAFTRGNTTSDRVQIDHVVALSDAWQKGAQALDFDTRVKFANDPLNLLAVDGPTNQKKGDSDAASWLPPNKDYRCKYVARQIAVKAKYNLWVTDAEKGAIHRVLGGCGDQRVPIETQSS